VHPDARGLGLGRRLLTELEGAAAERGHRVVRLDTHEVLKEAAALYRTSGYTEIPAYDDNAHAGYWFEKPLPPPSAPPRPAPLKSCPRRDSYPADRTASASLANCTAWMSLSPGAVFDLSGKPRTH
jgi:hypothetical protein